MNLRIYGSRVAIEAVGGDIHVDGRVIEQGHGQRAVLPINLTVGGTQLRVARDKMFDLAEFPELFSRWRGRLQAGVAAFAAFAVVSTLVYYMVDVKQAWASRLPVASSVTHDQSRSSGEVRRYDTTDSKSAPRHSPGERAVDALKQQIASKALAGLVVKNAGNRIIVTGDVSTTERASWTKVQKWFDSHYSDSRVLVSSVQTVSKPRAPNLHFKAVWFGDQPYVVDGNGERRYPGASLGDGWVLDNLHDHRITVRRSGRKFSFTF